MSENNWGDDSYKWDGGDYNNVGKSLGEDIYMDYAQYQAYQNECAHTDWAAYDPFNRDTKIDSHPFEWKTEYNCEFQIDTSINNPELLMTIGAQDDYLLEIFNEGERMVKLHLDGSIEYGEGYNVEDAAVKFWEAVSTFAPRISQIDTIEKRNGELMKELLKHEVKIDNPMIDNQYFSLDNNMSDYSDYERAMKLVK